MTGARGHCVTVRARSRIERLVLPSTQTEEVQCFASAHVDRPVVSCYDFLSDVSNSSTRARNELCQDLFDSVTTIIS